MCVWMIEIKLDLWWCMLYGITVQNCIIMKNALHFFVDGIVCLAWILMQHVFGFLELVLCLIWKLWTCTSTYASWLCMYCNWIVWFMFWICVWLCVCMALDAIVRICLYYVAFCMFGCKILVSSNICHVS